MSKNFYEILNASSNATFDELKSNYKHLILQCHPDKLLQQQQKLQQPDEKTCLPENLENKLNNKEFVAITEAWNCLKDPSRRKLYDAELLLNKFHTHNNIYAHIQLSEMKKCLMKIADDDELVNNESVQKTRGTQGEEESESVKSDNNKESTSYFYTYDCRCGGQYIVDESAEQFCRKVNNSATATAVVVHGEDNGGVDDGVHDDADFMQNNNSPNKTAGYRNGGALNDCLGDVDGAEAIESVAFNEDNTEVDSDDDDGELIVECSECSLVIILNG